jgi:23S rRNA pseudouridine1911/1915/1917 synthase
VDLTVPPEGAGERLDVFLAAHVGSRSAAQKLIDDGRVAVDGAARPKRHVLGGGERVRVAAAPEREPHAGPPAPFEIRFQDEHLLVVDKPAGVVTHPGAGQAHGTLAQALAGLAAGGDPERAGIVHRLDRETSGLLVVAKSEAVHRALRALLAERAITREYLALVEGRPPARTGTIDAPLGRDRRLRTRVSTDTDEPREAVTHFAVERALPATTLLRVRLETGRTHQIRAHLLAIGHPVVGDPEYGHPGLLGLARQFLHAARLAFRHPVSGAPVDVRSPLPADLAAALVLAEAGEAAAGARTEPRSRAARPVVEGDIS